MEFLPFVQMAVRVDKAKQDSDTTYFNDLLLYGELILKTCVLGFIGALVDDKDRQKYGLYHRLVRADGIGEWGSVLEDGFVLLP